MMCVQFELLHSETAESGATVIGSARQQSVVGKDGAQRQRPSAPCKLLLRLQEEAWARRMAVCDTRE